MAQYRFVTEWQVDATAGQVWDVLLDYRQWPSWWRGFRAVEQLESGDASGRGMRIRQSWRAWLPYTMVLDLEILDLQRPSLVQGRASGNVEGTCTWSLDERDGATTVRFVMDVCTTRWWMNLPVPFAGRVFAGNYDAIMRWGAEGMARVLGGRVVDSTREARLAGA
jgi:hypothetical protein